MTATPFDAPAVLDILADLPAVTIDWHPLPSNAAWVLTGEPGGQGVVIHEYYGEHEPRALCCPKHGVQRFDWNETRYVCKVCNK
jgi:hypothetical protein